MKVSKKHTDGDLITLEATVSSAEVGDALNQAGAVFCVRMGLQPTPSMSPAQAAQEYLGIKNLDEVVTQQAMESFVPQAISKAGIMPAYQPKPEAQKALARGQAFQFQIQVMPKPEYELTSYDPIAFSMPEYKMDESAVDMQISQIARQNPTYVTADPHPLGEHDTVALKLEISRDGKLIEGLSTDKRTYTASEGFMPEDFDKNIMGMEVGETRTFTFQGPDFDENYNQFMADFDATVTLLEIQKETIPVIDDEWVAKNNPLFKNVADFRAAIAKQLEGQGKRQYEEYKRNMASAELAKRFEGKIADEIYEGTMQEVQQRLYQQVTSSGQDWNAFLEQNGGQQQVNMLVMMQTREMLVSGFVLDAWYRHFGLVYTDEDINEVCFGMNPQNPKAAREQMEKGGFGFALRESAERLCAVKDLVEKADITYIDQAAMQETVTEDADGNVEVEEDVEVETSKDDGTDE